MVYVPRFENGRPPEHYTERWGRFWIDIHRLESGRYSWSILGDMYENNVSYSGLECRFKRALEAARDATITRPWRRTPSVRGR